MTVNRKDASRAKCDKWKRQKYFVLHSSLAVLFEEQQSNANKKNNTQMANKKFKSNHENFILIMYGPLDTFRNKGKLLKKKRDTVKI